MPPRNIKLVDRDSFSLRFEFDAPESVEGLIGYTVICNDVNYVLLIIAALKKA